MAEAKARITKSASIKSLLDAKIMMVDDEPTTMAVIRSFLKEDGYQNFILIDDASQALTVIGQKRPDLLLLDLMMPEVSGFDILKAVRKSPKFRHLPVIILTSSEKTEDKLRCLDLGATDFLGKPVDSSELRLRVRNTLAAKAYVDQLAYYDRHTKLPNRSTFFEHLYWVLKWARQTEKQLAVLSIELDQFDTISSTVGMRAGDEVLRKVAQRLQTAAKKGNFLGRRFDPKKRTGVYLSRFEGSIFSLLLYPVPKAETAAMMARHILDLIRKPLIIEDREVYLTASVGIATHPGKNVDGVGLMRHASSARNYAKASGGNTFQFSSRKINQQYQKRLNLEAGLRKALEKHELFLLYQPRVDTTTGALVGAEALVRWKRDDGRIISPDEFIPVAEETGLIIPIGTWILYKACTQLAKWHREENMPIGISVNLSAIQFLDPRLPKFVEKIIAKSQIDPQFLTLELTESIMMSDVEEKIDILRNLKSMGLNLAIDDFGTGFSSLNYLRKLPVDELKIDRSFISALLEEDKSMALASSVIYLGKKLGLLTVAEGVEKKEHLDFLKQQHCDLYQGALCSMPISNTKLGQLFHSSNRHLHERASGDGRSETDIPGHLAL